MSLGVCAPGDSAVVAGAREERTAKLKNAVRFFYDLQGLRIQASSRAAKKATCVFLDENDKRFLDETGNKLKELERNAIKEVARLLAGIPIYEGWLHEQRGIGPTLAGVLISEFNIDHCATPSQMWAWAGLAVRDGKADHRIKGQRTTYNPWLKSKMTEVLGGSLLKCRSPYRALYDAYKNRKQNERVNSCMNCCGTGAYRPTATSKPERCLNCDGTGVLAPWGKSDAHRHRAAMRYMVKQFLAEYWRAWRMIEALPTRPPYSEEFLGRIHHTIETAKQR